MAQAILIVVLVGCAQVEGRLEHPGHVYNCGGELEYCYLEDAADELSDLTGRECRNITVLDRVAPWLLGCWYHCDDPATEPNEADSPGCNAHLGGCFCG